MVEGQRLMQAASDIFLGWLSGTDPDGVTRDFYVRQLWDGKGSAEIEKMDPDDHGASMAGSAAGRWPDAHARSGDRIAIASYLGKGEQFDKAMGVVRGGLRRAERAVTTRSSRLPSRRGG